MSNSVDQRIVEMQFDNSQFEKGIESTLSSLKNMEKALTLKNGTSGLESVDEKLTSITKNVEETSSKFSVMGVAAFTAVNRITSSIMDLGANIARSATIQPLLDGLDEYHLKMNSIKTIQTNTMGKSSLEDINKALAELNTYADKTIYNFAEMTHNIGTFTAAGVDLERSTSAIQGIANLAAAAGSDANQASRAMYNLSQALSIGSLKLQDWKSIEMAGMGGKFFQEALIETARVMNTGVDEAIEARGSFRESLRDDWVTTEVLTQTLENFTYATNEMTEAEKKATDEKLKGLGYSDEQIEKIYEQANAAQDAATKVRTFEMLIDTTKEALGSGWAQTWEYIIGDLKEAEDLFTGISKALGSVIDPITDARNKFFKKWHDAGGRNSLISVFQKAARVMPRIGNTLKHSFDNIFGSFTGKKLAKKTKDLSKFVKGVADSLTTPFQKSKDNTVILFNTMRRTVSTVLTALGKGIEGVVGAASGLFSGALSGGFKAFASAVKFARRLALSFAKFVKNSLYPGLKNAFKPVGEFFESINMPEIPKFFKNLTKGIGDFFGSLGSKKSYRKDFIKDLNGMAKAVKSLGEKFGKTFENAGKTIGAFFDGATKGIKESNGVMGDAIKVFDELVGAPIAEGFKSTFENVRQSISDAFKGFSESDAIPQVLKDIFKGFSDFFDASANDNMKDFLKSVKEFSKNAVADGIQRVADGIKNFAQSFDEFRKAHGEEIMGKISSALETVGKVWGVLEGAFNRVKDALSGAIDFIKTAFEQSGITVDPFLEFFGKVKDAFGEFFAGEEGKFDFGSLFENIKSGAESLISDVAPKFSQFVDMVTSPITDRLMPVLEDLGGWAEKIGTPFSNLREYIGNFDFAKMFSSPAAVDFGEEGFVTGGIKAFFESDKQEIQTFSDEAFSLARAFENVGLLIKNPMGKAKESFLGVFKGFGQAFTEFTNELSQVDIEKFVSMLGSIGVSAGVVVGLLNLTKAVGAISTVALSIKGALGSIAGVFGEVKQTLETAQSMMKVHMFLELVLGVVAIVGVLVALAYLADVDKIMEVVPLVAGVTLALTGIVLLFGILSAHKKAFNFRGVTFITAAIEQLAIAIAAIVGVLALASMLQKYGDLSEGLVPVFSVIAVFVLFSALMSMIKVSNIATAGATMMAIAQSLLLVLLAIEIVAHIPDEDLDKGVPIIIKIMGMLALLAGLIGFMTGLSKGSSMLSGMGGVLLGMAAMLLVCAAVVKILGTMEQDDLDKATQTLSNMVVMIGAMVLVIGILNTLGGKGTGLAAPLAAMTGTIIALAVAIGGLALVAKSGADLQGAMLALAGGLIALGIAMAFMSAVAPNMIAVSIGMIALVVALGALLAIAFLISGIADTITSGLLALVPAFLYFIAALTIVGAVGLGVGPGLWAISVAFVALAAAALIVVGAMALFSVIADSFTSGLQKFMDVASTAFAKDGIAVDMVGVAAGMIVLGVACGILAIGLGLLALAVWGFGAAFPEAAKNVMAAIRSMAEFFSSERGTISSAVTSMLQGVIDGINNFILPLMQQGKNLVDGLSKGISQNKDTIRNGVGDVIGAIGTGLWEGIKALGPIILDLLEALFLGIMDGIAAAVTGPVNWINDQLYELTGGLMGVAPQAKESAEEIATQTAEGLASKDEELGASTKAKIDELDAHIRDKAPEAGEASQEMATAITNPFEQIGGKFDFFKAFGLDDATIAGGFDSVKAFFQGKGIELPDELITQFANGASGFDAWEMIQSNGNVDMSQFSDLMGEGAIAGADTFTGQFDERMNDVDIMSIVANAADIDVETLKENFSGAAAAAATAFSEGFADNMKLDGTGPMQKAAAALKASSGSMNGAGKSAADAVVRGFSGASKDMRKYAKSAAKDAVTAVKSESGNAKTGGYEVGYNMGSGLKSGLDSGSTYLSARAAQIVRNAIAAMKAAAREKSPSRETIWISEMMMQGMMVGFDNLRDNVAASAAGVVTNSLTAMATQAAYVSGLLDDIDDQPTIRPVLDLTDYEAGISRMQGLNASAPMNSAQLANRLSSSVGDAGYYNSNRSMVINLNYGAGTSAADMVNEMAMILQTKNLMEA